MKKVVKTEGQAFDPLLVCLLQVTRLKDVFCSEESLIAGLPLVEQRLTPELFIRAAERASLKAKVVQRKLVDIPAIVLPVVLLLKNNQAVVLTQLLDDQQATILDPNASDEQEKTIALAKLEKYYTGYAIYLKAQENFEQGVFEKKEEHWFWRVIQSSWKVYRDVLLASFFINLFVVATPLFVMNVFNRVAPNAALETLWVLALGVMVVYVFDILLKLLRGYFIELAGKKSDILLSSFLFQRVMGARYDQRPSSVGSFVSQFREFDTVRNFFTASSIVAVVDLPFTIIFLLLIYYIGGSLVWVPLLALPLIIAYGLLLQGPIRRAVEQTFESAAQKNATLVESLVGLETVKILGAEGFLQRHWERAVGHLAKWSQRVRLLSLSVTVFSGGVQLFAGVVLMIIGIYMMTEREIMMGTLVACFMLSSRALGPISQVANLLVSYDQTKTALQALDSIVEKTQERDPKKPFVKRPSFKGSIQFNQVTFFYPSDLQVALNQVSFKIEPGEKVAIIGRVGSGKTTVQKLLLNLYQPSLGNILIDGIDHKQIDPADIRRHVGYVPQDIILFSGTIKSNILYGSPHIDDEELLRVAEVSGVKEFVNRHPLGFDRPTGERGEALSGGQRQSIGIARALLNDPSIVILDEPTNGMDNSTEILVKEQLQAWLQQRTLLLVTHKMGLLSMVDRVIVLDNGKIVADGEKEIVLEALKKGQLRVAQN